MLVMPRRPCRGRAYICAVLSHAEAGRKELRHLQRSARASNGREVTVWSGHSCSWRLTLFLNWEGVRGRVAHMSKPKPQAPPDHFCSGGTYSFGLADPSPKKNCSSCLTMTS